MRLTSKARYGLIICFRLGISEKPSISITEIAACTGYSAKYIEKLMKYLKRAAIVKAERGAGGGYALSKKPEDISLGRIIRALEDNLEFVDCIGSGCKNECCCPTYDVWKKLYRGINDLLDSMTLKDIIDDYKSGGEKNDKTDISGPCGNHKC